jgi:hypothetical protein
MFSLQKLQASTVEEQDRPVHVPVDGSAASLSYLFSKQTAIVPPPTAEYAPPSRAWVNTTLSSFSELRWRASEEKERKGWPFLYFVIVRDGMSFVSV